MNQEVIETSVEILGKTYSIKCPRTKIHALESATKFLEKKVKETKKSGDVLGSERVMMVAALNLAHELESALQKLKAIQDQLDEGLTRFSQMELRPEAEVGY